VKSPFRAHSGFRIQDSGFKIQDSRFKIQDSGFRIQDSGFKIQDSSSRLATKGLKNCRTFQTLNREALNPYL